MAKITSLWMGDLEPYMDERFVQNALSSLGEPVLSVRVIRQKIPGMAGYCFLEFGSEQAASQAINKLNGLPVPGTHPMKRFRLNWANSGGPGGPPLSMTGMSPTTALSRPGIGVGVAAAAAAAASAFDPVEKYQVALEQHRQVVERLQQYQQYQHAYLNAMWQACQQKDGGEEEAEGEGEKEETNAVAEPVQGLTSLPDIDAMNKKVIFDYNILFDEADQVQWSPIEKLAPLLVNSQEY